MIETSALRCGYGPKEVLKGIALRVQPGEMTGILGPNGSGKTTLLLALTGVIGVSSGTVRVAGEDIQGRSPGWIAKQVASVPQRAEISFGFKCLSLVLMGRYPYMQGWGDYSTRDIEAALTAMEETRTAHLAHRMINEVSGGEAQMVIIARALAQQTRILLLDEATSNLDVARKLEVFDLLSEKNRNGMTLLCVMHDLNLAALYCSRLIFLKDGQVALDGPTEDVFNDKNLSEIYETEIRVGSHPVTGTPQAHFVPRGRSRVSAGSLGPGTGE
ncbi:MAG: ABC transporter ATP-binding protein [Thermodesulfobacteriota bacterium]